MNKLLPKTTLFLLLFITAIAFLWLPIQADEPTAVDVAVFNLTPLNNAVRIDWETATELNTAGFRIKRATTGGNEEFLDYIGENGFIPAAGNVTTGSTYTVTDNQVQNGSVYTYILFEVENSGTETEQERATVTVGLPSTNTPAPISGGSGNDNNATATPRPTETATQRATATLTKSSTTTAPPTNTPPSFVTVTPKSVQPTASPTPSPNPVNNNQSRDTIANANNDNEEIETTGTTITGVTEVLAQEDSTTETGEIAAQTDIDLTQQTQDGYPGVTATAVSSADEVYPNDTANNDTVATPVPVIGSSQGYTGTESDTPNTTNGTASTSQGQIFLWLGFIVALLIFITGLIGSIILFTRKSQ